MGPVDNREEGELSEEGELPEEPEQEEPISKVTNDEKPADQAVVAAVQQVAAADATPATDKKPQQQHVNAQQQLRAGREDRDRRVGRSGRGGGQEHEKHREHDKHRVEQEKAELSQELERLTRDLSFQEMRTNWEKACQDTRNAIKKLDKLLRRVKRRREDDVELYPACYSFSTRILGGLKHVVVICSTGLGKLADMELANNLMRTAINYRHDVFSLSQKRELEQLLCDSKEFRHLFLDREKGRNVGKPGSGQAGAPGGGSSRGHKADDKQGQQRVPLQRGQPQQEQRHSGSQQQQDRAQDKSQAPHSVKSDGMQASVSKDEAMSEASHAAAGADSSGATAPTPSYDKQQAATGTAAEDSPATAATPQGGATGQQASSIGKADTIGVGAATASKQPGGSRSGPAGQQIKIVINSTKVAQPVGSAAGADSMNGGPGVKRSLPAVEEISAEVEGVHAAKRARQQDQASPGDQADSEVVLSELPEVAAAMNNPSNLQAVLQQLLGSRRLCLVLDLDHTLVNSAKFSEVDGDWEYKLEQLAADQLSRPKELRDLHRLARVSMWTKLRPGVRAFLQRAAELFELWIYTAGSKAYADAMVDLLDPTGVYFNGRVIAQGAPSSPEENVTDPVVFKRLMQGLEGREPVLLIVDDSSAVWPYDRRNLFVVERYIYFPSSRKRFGMQGKSLLEIDRDECSHRGMLMTAMRVFEHLHDLVFQRMKAAPLSLEPKAAAAWDIRNIMAAEKRQVLAGVHLVFSRVIPLEANPRTHPLWQLAEQFGATCGEQCTEHTTHVVATHGGTEKVAWARQNNKFVVSPAWLECSCILWHQADEDKFPTPGM